MKQPAGFCGVVGLKPTYGSVSRHGLMAMGSSLDVIGPIAKNVTDTEILFNAIKGKDSYDSTSIDVSDENSKVKDKKLTIGVPRHFLKGDGIDKEVMSAFEKTLKKLEAKGYKVVDIELPHIEYSLAVYYVLMPAEVSTNLSRFDGVKYGFYKKGEKLIDDYVLTRGEGFGKEARRRIMLGAYVLSSGYYDAYYTKASQVRDLLKKDFLEAFLKVDVIITPTTPSPAFKIGEKTSDPVAMYLEDIFTVTANLVGVPALSVPMGVKKIDDVVLPLGIQCTSRHGEESVLFRVGKDIADE